MKEGDHRGSQKVFVLVLVAAAFAAGVLWQSRHVRKAGAEAPQLEHRDVATHTAVPAPAPVPEPAKPLLATTNQALAHAKPVMPVPATNVLDRLAQIREQFRALADGDRTNALRAAKLMTNATEREAALLTLVTAWRQGVLSPPAVRAQAVADHGLEAGLGMELAKSDPALAMAWANELTDAAGRQAVLQQAARTMLLSDPSAAFALSGQVPEADQRKFALDLYTTWASVDTDAALQSANQLASDADRNAAIDAIHTAAPVGIGTALKMDGGYPMISDLVAGAAAESSGQLHVGDRIVALAQGDNQFVSLQNASLQDIVAAIRGQPNTVLQLQVIPAGADPGSQPTTVNITRNQIKFKQ